MSTLAQTVTTSTTSSAGEPPAKRPKLAETIVYHGERKCEFSADCKNHAYWSARGLYLCGVHSKRYHDRRELPKRAKKETAKLHARESLEHQKSVDKKTAENRASGLRGTVRLYRMRMMHNPDKTPGVLNVFPNNRHQNRTDGFGCSALSPMRLGPVHHGQSGLPDACNLENFHQGSKCFLEETLEGGDDPSPLFYENRAKFYADPVPHRHKYRGIGPNKNAPLYFVWVGGDLKEHRLSYVESRQFYCTFYERLASKQPDYQRLRDLLAQGTELCICGYDAAPLEPGETIEMAYLDFWKPFGHERVLYAMLTATHPEQLPWRKYKMFDF